MALYGDQLPRSEYVRVIAAAPAQIEGTFGVGKCKAYEALCEPGCLAEISIDPFGRFMYFPPLGTSALLWTCTAKGLASHGGFP